ncbi:MAG: flagellar basal body-associated protein FliL [Alphaproteobacteria bacterium]|jgi:flagellar basal body-associated protein FliL
MDHKPENDATDTKDTINDIKSVDNNHNNTNDTVTDAVTPSEKNTLEKEISTPKKKKSIITTIIILIIFIAIAASLFIFCYDKNLAGVRDITNTAYQKIFPNHAPNTLMPTNTSQIISRNVSDKPINLNATQQDKQNIPEISKKSNVATKDKPQARPIEQKPLTQEKNTPLVKSEITQPEKSLDEFIASLPKVPAVPNNIENNQNLIQNLIKGHHAQAKSIFKKFNSLNNQFSNGDPYLEALITLKTQLKKSNILIPTLTEYASGGFPTDIIIVSDALKSLKRLAIMQSRQQPANTLENIIGKFMVITPTSNIKGFSGKLYDIKKALNDADFDTVLEGIKALSPQKQKTFNSLKIVIQDKKKVQTELNQLNDAIIDDIFTLNQ